MWQRDGLVHGRKWASPRIQCGGTPTQVHQGGEGGGTAVPVEDKQQNTITPATMTIMRWGTGKALGTQGL